MRPLAPCRYFVRRPPPLARATLALGVLALAGPAAAQSQADATIGGATYGTTAANRTSPWEFGGGLYFGLGGNTLGKPANIAVPYTTSMGQKAAIADTTYPGFGGVFVGVGFFAEARYKKYVGLEIDAFTSSDSGNADITINGATSHLSVGESAWHVPVLAKGILPLPMFSPYVEFGPEFVLPGSANVTADANAPQLARTLDATVSNYLLLTLGVGVEWKTPVPFVDLRVPLTLRGSYNPGVSDKVVDREHPNVTQNGRILSTTFDSNWQWRGSINVGAAVYF